MAIDTTGPRTRRAVLMGALSGVAASAAAAVGRAGAVRATNGDAMLVGHTYAATSETGIRARGVNALVCSSNNRVGITGNSHSFYGVTGLSQTLIGVDGTSNSTQNPGVRGRSGGNSTGVEGLSGTNFPQVPAKTGVFGYADQDANARGVQGQTTVGHGVFGLAGAGIGCRGYSTTGTALYASTGGPKSGVAIRALGRVKLDNCSGLATIAAGHNSVVVTPGTDLVATSAVVATIQGNPSGAAMVKSVAVNATADTFTIYLSANATAALTVAWHAFG